MNANNRHILKSVAYKEIQWDTYLFVIFMLRQW